MKNVFQNILLVAISTFVVISCTKEDDEKAVVFKKQVMETYANIAFANYTKAYEDAVVLKNAIATFTTTPTLVNFDNAKAKWKLSRESYGTTEGFRFANGPIDDANGPEALINAWPMDENFIDYNGVSPNAGIINNLVLHPTIDKASLLALNEDGGEKNISIGYHAIEFLLWGEDVTAPSANKPGLRPYTDYLISGGTASNQARRALYINVCADLLAEKLLYLVNQWKVGGAYRSTFLALNEDVAIKNMYLGITTLISAELPIERMDVALLNGAQEDEHSCFSDNTHRDIILNTQSVINIYQGYYNENANGPSLEDLVAQANRESAYETNNSLNLSITKVNAIMNPFDLAISGGKDSIEGAKVRAAVIQLKDFGANLLNGASKIGITVN